MLQFESIWLVFLKLALTQRYLDFSITQGGQTRVVTADVPVRTQGVLYVVDEVL